MSYKFNPFTGTFDYYETSTGSPSAPVNAIQYNNPLGTFAGDADFIRDLTDATNRYGVKVGMVSGATSNYTVWTGDYKDNAGWDAYINPGYFVASNVFTALNASNGASDWGGATFINQDNSGANVYGAFFVGVNKGANPSATYGGYSDAEFKGTGTNGSNTGHYMVAGNLGSGTITSNSGAFIGSAVNSGGGAITTNYGLYIADQTVGGTNYAIYTGLGKVRFGDHVTVESVTSTGATGSGKFVFDASPGLTGNPTAPTQTANDNSTKIATTAYVDNAVLETNYKEAVKVATTAALVGTYNNGTLGVGAFFLYTATGTNVIDGVTLALNDRVLVKNQGASDLQNGIYKVTTAGALGVAGVLTRTTDFDQSADIMTGDTVFVTAGTVNANTLWSYTGIDSPTMGTTSLTFVQVSADLIVGQSLILSGTTTRILYDNAGTLGEYTISGSGTVVAMATGATLTTPTLSGKTSVADAATLDFILPTTNNTATGHTTSAFNSGYSSTAISDLVILDSSATWQKTDANTTSIAVGMLAIALQVSASGAAVKVALPGSFINSSSFPTMTAGANMYMSETAGAITATAPTTTDAYVMTIGQAVSATVLFFNPMMVPVTHS